MWVNSQLVQGASGGLPICVYGRPYSGFQTVANRSASAAASVVLPVDSAPSRHTRFTSAVTRASLRAARVDGRGSEPRRPSSSIVHRDRPTAEPGDRRRRRHLGARGGGERRRAPDARSSAGQRDRRARRARDARAGGRSSAPRVRPRARRGSGECRRRGVLAVADDDAEALLGLARQVPGARARARRACPRRRGARARARASRPRDRAPDGRASRGGAGGARPAARAAARRPGRQARDRRARGRVARGRARSSSARASTRCSSPATSRRSSATASPTCSRLA